VDTILTILAAAGIGAAAWHVVRAAFRFLRHGADTVWANELGRAGARRGDLTAVQESARERAGAARARAVAETAGWLALLVVPALTPWSRPVYASYALLWALPAVRRRGP
jgi:hypothetical protein